MPTAADITPVILRQLIDYDHETGSLTWKPRSQSWFNQTGPYGPQAVADSWNTRYAGKPALSSASGPYLGGAVFGRKLTAHRVAWAIANGVWPIGEIDHINGDCRDNRLGNLRDVQPLVNMRNKKLVATNTSGVMGVRWDEKARSWVVTIGGRARRAYIGSFKAFDDAVAARRQAENQRGYHANHGRTERSGP